MAKRTQQTKVPAASVASSSSSSGSREIRSTGTGRSSGETEGETTYEEVGMIGYGAHGEVFKARSSTSESFVALKKVRIPVSEDGVPIPIIREIALLKQLENFAHPNIVRLLDICDGTPTPGDHKHFTLHLVFEHVEQDLSSYLTNCPSPGLCVDRIRDIMRQIMCGVDFLHSNRIVHRDLKPQNILVSNSGQVKLADFGLARIYEEMQILTTVVVTLWYRSPEVILKSSYASPVDVWSCGCILSELFSRKPLFPGRSESDQLTRIFRLIGSPSQQEWPPDISISWKTFSSFRSPDWQSLLPLMDPSSRDLLSLMLTFDPSKRLSAQQVLHHAFLRLDSESDVLSTPTSSSSPSSSPCHPTT